WSLILVFIVFQNDIRRALTQVGTGPLFSSADRVAQSQAVEELVKGVTSMASRRVGALVVLQNEVGLNEYIEVGTRLDAQVSKELVSSIFMPGSPIHDGALIIQQGRITAAGCFLPLTTNPTVSKTLGTRHRAAIGLTEETDALAIVVSEEDGMVSLVREGKITLRVHQPAGYVVTNAPTKPIAVTVRGPRTILDGVEERRIHFALDLATAAPGDVRQELNADMIRPPLPRRLKIVRIEPGRVK